MQGHDVWWSAQGVFPVEGTGVGRPSYGVEAAGACEQGRSVRDVRTAQVNELQVLFLSMQQACIMLGPLSKLGYDHIRLCVMFSLLHESGFLIV
jgi:hypothetical protein